MPPRTPAPSEPVSASPPATSPSGPSSPPPSTGPTSSAPAGDPRPLAVGAPDVSAAVTQLQNRINELEAKLEDTGWGSKRGIALAEEVAALRKELTDRLAALNPPPPVRGAIARAVDWFYGE